MSEPLPAMIRIRTLGAAFALCFVLILALAPSCLQAQGLQEKVVRVGWFESSFNYSDRFGRRSGYAYDYQQKIAAYTGWTYEYVEASWPELFEMLKKGQIDLMSDISYTQERAGAMLFSSLPMGVETFYVFISVNNTEITLENPASLKGKKVGVNKNSFQQKLFLQWTAEKGIDVEVVELTGPEKDSVKMLEEGKLDAFVTVDGYTDEYTIVPVFKLGLADFFFAVNKQRPDLLNELNVAMNRIQDENKFFNRQLYEKYILRKGSASFLFHAESDWLTRHGRIRVGYWNDYLPFCKLDQKTGKLTGALKDYLTLASSCMKNVKIDFDAIAYPTFESALNALRAGLIDCIFPVNFSLYDGEKMGVLVTSPFMQTEMFAVMRKSDHLVVLPDQEMTVAVKEGNPNYDMFIKDHFPNWKLVTFSRSEECLRAVEAGEADCALLNNYRVVQKDVLRNSKLTSLSTGAAMHFSFAIRKSDSELYSILNKIAAFVPVTAVDSALTAYSYPDETFSFTDFFIEHLAQSIATLIITLLLLVLFLVRRAKRRAQALEERLALQNRILEQERQKHQSDAMITAMASDYRSVFYINLDKDEGVCFRAKVQLHNGIKEGSSFSFREANTQYAQTHVVEAERAAFLQFVEPDNIRACLAKEPMIAHRYLAIRDGREIYEMLRIVDISQIENSEDHSVHTVCAGFFDVDSETRAEMAKNRTLSDALNEAEAANVAKTSFLSSMSHEIRTPMNAIIGLNSIALKDKDLPQRTREYLEKIGTSAKHLMRLINDILDMSRIESGRMTIRNALFSFREMLDQINIMINGQCQNKGLQYDCQIIGHIDDYYIGDDMKLKQVLINILGNAVKFTPAPGSVSLLVEALAKFEDNATLRFTMKDTGIGMDSNFLPRMFEPFSQEDENKANKYGSTGLGMAITKNIVEMMNGKIEVKSEKGVGSAFVVTIPLKSKERTEDAEAYDIHPQDLHVLIVDGDTKASFHSQQVLELGGIEADVCHSGEQAYDLLKLAQARQQPYNLILVDWNLPGQDGLEVTRTIRQNLANTSAIIMLTADNWWNMREEALQAGVDACMAKPIFVSVVLQEYQQAMRRKESVQKQTHRASLTGKRVLLAEDMLINAEIMQEILHMREVEVEHAENGQRAVEMFKEHPEGYYNAILMDVLMPVLDGLHATETIRAMDRPDAKTIPIIAMTANAFDEYVQRSLQAGMNAHLSKPVEPEKLFETLTALIRED